MQFIFFVMGVIMRQSIKGTLANYVGIVIGFITTFFVLTHYLTEEQVGLTRVLVDAAVLFSGLAQLGTTASMIRFYPYFKNEENKDHGIFFWSLIIPLVGFILFLIFFFLFQEKIVSIFADKSPLFVDYFYFVLPLSFFMLYMSVFEVNSNILMRIAWPKLIREVVIRVLLLVCYILFGVGIITLNGLVIAFCVVYGLAALLNIAFVLVLKKVSFKPDFKFLTKSLVKNFAFYTLFLVTAALAGNITPILNTFFVSAKMGLTYTGIFAIANYIAAVIEVPYRSLGAIAQPQISMAIKNNDIFIANNLCQKVSLHQLLAGSFVFLLIWINIDFLFTIIPNGSSYGTGKWVVLILSLSKLFNSSLSVGITVLSYSKWYYLSLIFTFILTFTAIFLNIKLIPIMGMNGAAMATFISYVFYYLCVLSLIKWKMNTSPFSNPQLKVVILFVILFALNELWLQFLTPFFQGLFLNSLVCGLFEAGIKSLILVGLGAFFSYYFQISLEVNSLIDKYLKIKKS